MNLDDVIKTYGAIKDLTSFNKYMFVGPHPDDIEFGCGGLISKLKELNKEVIYVIMTDGAAGTSDPAITPSMMKDIRYKESLKAAEFLNVKQVEFLDLEDGSDYEVVDAVRKLAPVIVKHCPDIIFAPDSKLSTECHSDHLKTGEAVRICSQLVSHPTSLKRHKINIDNFTSFPNNITLAFYFTDDSNKLVEISENNLNEKIQSLLIHASQNADPSAELLLNYFKLKALKLGEKSSTHLAEDYKVLVPLTQHCYSDGIHY